MDFISICREYRVMYSHDKIYTRLSVFSFFFFRESLGMRLLNVQAQSQATTQVMQHEE